MAKITFDYKCNRCEQDVRNTNVQVGINQSCDYDSSISIDTTCPVCGQTMTWDYDGFSDWTASYEPYKAPDVDYSKPASDIKCEICGKGQSNHDEFNSIIRGNTTMFRRVCSECRKDYIFREHPICDICGKTNNRDISIWQRLVDNKFQTIYTCEDCFNKAFNKT